LIKHVVNRFVIDRPAFLRYFNAIYDRKPEWVGCFGLMSIITHDFLVKMQQMTSFVSLAAHIDDKRRRCAVESIFAIAAQFTAGRPILGSYDGLYMDGRGYHNGFKTKTFEKLVLSRCSCVNCTQTKHPEWKCVK
jgi:hypothetical protein